jgi:26S proteasome regulatory subunit N7
MMLLWIICGWLVIVDFITAAYFSAGLTEQIKLDRYLQPHFRYYMREVRTVVYSQFLESYKSVTMEAMAAAFGVTIDFIDQ